MRTETFLTSALRTNHLVDRSSYWERAAYPKQFAGASAGKLYAPRARAGKIDVANDMPGYTDKHASAGIGAKLPAIETWPNQFPGYTITIRIPEYTSVCPKTGLPDYGAITIQYEPKKLCLELKSLKLYLLAYRNLGIFYENAVNRILKDVVASVKPVWCRVTGDFTPRGGLTTSIEARWPRGR
jgi:7-cyano-7-deazaguanine reductase